MIGEQHLGRNGEKGGIGMVPKTMPLTALKSWFQCGFRELLRVWALWKLVAQKIGNFQARLLMLLFYCVILAPFGVGVKLFADPLRLKHQHLSHWGSKARSTAALLDGARRQF
jgi:hypothetical protein